jgi:hypothetical protein
LVFTFTFVEQNAHMLMITMNRAITDFLCLICHEKNLSNFMDSCNLLKLHVSEENAGVSRICAAVNLFCGHIFSQKSSGVSVGSQPGREEGDTHVNAVRQERRECS